jgi:linoleoyl-CoA desaturase
MKPQFQRTKEDTLFRSLRKEVNEMVAVLSPGKQRIITAKALIFPLLYVAAYTTALVYGSEPSIFYLCYFFLGIFLVMNFLNLIHEAVHHTLFQNKKFNDWYVYAFDLMGANSYVWKLRHTRLHHNYPNIMGWDSDIEQSSLARIFPTGKFYRLHKYQHIYLPILYPLYLFNWLLVRDFKDFFDSRKLVHKITKIPPMEYVKLFIFKAFFLFYLLVLPAIILQISLLQIVCAFFIMMVTASIFALIVLLPPHANVESEFPQVSANGEMPSGWFMHQLSTTNDVKEDNWFIRFFLGSFNYHIVHHLFPNVHHIYYPEINKLLEKYAQEHQLPYRRFPILTCLRNHFYLLKNNSVHENLFEETM